MGTSVLARAYRDWSGNLTTHLHPMLRSRMGGAIPTPTVCLHGMDRENFTFIKNNIFFSFLTITKVRVGIEWLANAGFVH